mgnify:CR=1 FL=1
MSFFRNYDFPVTFTRAANVFGEGQQLYRIVPKTIISGLLRTKLNLHGGGTSERSFIHIEDVSKVGIGANDKFANVFVTRLNINNINKTFFY